MTYTNQKICTRALRKIGVIATDTSATADEIADALDSLYEMLLSWQNLGYNLWQQDSTSVTATTSASYNLSDPRPLDIQSARYKSGTIEIPMYRMNREEYDTLPDKTTTGTPTTFYYQRGRDAGTLFVWPVLAAATTQTFELTVVGPSTDVAPSDVIDVPPEWYNAVIYGLAAQLADAFEIDSPKVVARAGLELDKALSYDREESVYFVGCD